jgi:hypothetical protein
MSRAQLMTGNLTCEYRLNFLKIFHLLTMICADNTGPFSSPSRCSAQGFCAAVLRVAMARLKNNRYSPSPQGEDNGDEMAGISIPDTVVTEMDSSSSELDSGSGRRTKLISLKSG